MEDAIRRVFEEVWRDQNSTAPPSLETSTVLLDTGLDSLGFAIIVTRLEELFDYDPFSLADDAYYPQTFGEFAAFYEKYRPQA